MLDRDHHKRRTDQAWNTLYQRLEKEGLLPVSGEEGAGRKASRKLRLPLFARGTARWAAAVLLCLCMAGAWWIARSPERPPLLTVQNETNEATLVTTLEDGSIVYLAGNAQLQFPSHFPANRREVSLEGNALFDISGNRERPFIIETEQIRIEVLGTAFHVKSSEVSPFELAVQRGEVSVTQKTNGKEIRVKAGETVTLLSGRLNLAPTQDTEQFRRYTERIQFKDESLGNIIRVLNLMFPPDSQLQTTEALSQRRLTVSFRQDTPETMAALICLALDLRCQREGGRILILEP